MGFFDIDLRKIDWKNFSFKEVLEGCRNAEFAKRNIGDKAEQYKAMAEKRLAICETCELFKNNRCTRDWKKSDEVEVLKLTNEQFTTASKLDKNVDFNTIKEQVEQHYIISNKLHTVHEGKAYVGCGCMLNCKTFNPNSTCPAGKWMQEIIK